MPIIYSNVTTEPSGEPISLAEAKTHLRVDHDEENGMIQILIQAAREIAEKTTNRSLITQTRTIKLDYFPRCGEFKIPYGPISSDPDDFVITYYDENEVLQTLDSDDYWLDTTSGIPRVRIKNSWPSTFDMPNAVIIEYVAGYGTSSDVPKRIKQAMYLILGHLYENKEQVMDTQMYELPFGADVLLNQYVVEHSVIY